MGWLGGWRWVGWIAGVALLASACGDGGSSSAKSSVPAANVGASLGGSPLPACPDPATPLPASATDWFGPGERVEQHLSAQLGVSRDKVGVAAGVSAPEGDPATAMPWLEPLQSHVLDVPAWDRQTVDDITYGARAQCPAAVGGPLTRTLAALAARDDNKGPATPVAPAIPDLDTFLDAAHPLRSAFQAVYNTNDAWPGRPAAPSFAEVQPQIDQLAADLGPESERALARVIDGMAKAEEWRVQAVSSWYGASPNFDDMSNLFLGGGAVGGDGMADHAAGPGNRLPNMSGHLTPAQARSFDTALMDKAGVAEAWAIERLAQQFTDHPMAESVDFHITTPLGEVALKGADTDDTWNVAAPALIVDQRGNDVYQGVVAGPASEAIPLSAVVDLSGNDRYDSGGGDHSQAAGVLSFGFLVDMAGDDAYVANDDAQGVGLLGVGGLLDAGGNDTYSARYDAQGSGQYGIGAAVDLGGNDRWTFTSEGQGSGGVRGAGALVDAAGDDVYVADDHNLINPSAQTQLHNFSDAQGSGSGQNNSSTQSGPSQTSMDGGLGVLADLAGNDSYSCGVFCQGSGYWFSNGILYDTGGDDSYTAAWYAQGAAAHFAIGALVDEAGNDNYSGGIQMLDGAGHDRSAGFLVDSGGDDHSIVRPLSHGGANDQGFGFYVDSAGNDSYDTQVGTRDPGGWYGANMVSGDFVNASRTQGGIGVGYFLDATGDDDYRGAPDGVGNGTTWKLPDAGPNPPPGLLSLGEDLST